MKKINKILALCCLMAVGCSEEKVDSPAIQDKVSPKVQASLTTKATTPIVGLLPTHMNVGLYTTSKDATVQSAYFANYSYTSDAMGALTTTQNSDITVGSNYDFYAYAPYQSGTIDATAIAFAHGVDVLCAARTTLLGVSPTNCAVTLPFKHAAAQISFKIVFDDHFITGTPQFTATSSLKVSGFYASGTLDVTTGVLTPVGAANVAATTLASATAGSMTLAMPITCFVPAANGSMSFGIQVTHEGQTYSGTVTDSFVGGNAYNYTITLKGKEDPAQLTITGGATKWIPVSVNMDLTNN